MDKRSELATYITATKGIIDAQQIEDEIKEMAALCPPAQASEQNAETDVDKAYITMQIQKGSTGESTSTTTSVGVLETAPMHQMSTEEQVNIKKVLLEQQENRSLVGSSSQVLKLIFDRPAPIDVIPEGQTSLIDDASWKRILEKFQAADGYELMPDDNTSEANAIASTSNFHELEAAKNEGRPVRVYRGKGSSRPIGYLVQKGSTDGKDSQPIYMTRDQLQNFVIMDTSGYILATETTPGVSLRKIKGNRDITKGKIRGDKVVLADQNKAEAIKNGAVEVTRRVDNTNMVKATLKSELTFRVKYKTKTLSDGVTPKTTVVRASIKTEIPSTVRERQYIDVFGTGESSNKNFTVAPTGKQAEALDEARVFAISELLAKTSMTTGASFEELSALQPYEAKLAAFKTSGSNQPPA